MSTDGTKVSTDPAGLDNPKVENPGVVTSDSLAAESIRAGESFAEDSSSRGPTTGPSAGSTAANTDTTNARTLDSAPDAEARSASEEWSEQGQLNAASSLGKLAGVGPTYNIPDSSTINIASGQAEQAPSYVSNQLSGGGAESMPKGKNLEEGGIPDGAPNASWGTNIGGKSDPGRAALGKFEEENVPVAGGAGPRQSEITNDGQFDSLKDTSA